MATPGYLNTSRREERQRPLAEILGKGKYLVPKLEPSPHCQHKETSHGANRLCSYQKCLDCGQEQKMPLTPLQDLHHWNSNLAFMQEDFLKRMINKAEQKNKAKADLGATPKAAPKRQTAVKSRAMAKAEAVVKTEVKEEEWENAVSIGEEDVAMMELTHNAHMQSCDACHVGEVTLHQHSMTGRLIWKCDNMQCQLHLQDQSRFLEQARGVFLCPHCNVMEMMPISATSNPEETELQCMNSNCSLAIFMFEMPLVYSKMGRFDITALM